MGIKDEGVLKNLEDISLFETDNFMSESAVIWPLSTPPINSDENLKG